jgi:hypothetical protein
MAALSDPITLLINMIKVLVYCKPAPTRLIDQKETQVSYAFRLKDNLKLNDYLRCPKPKQSYSSLVD